MLQQGLVLLVQPCNLLVQPDKVPPGGPTDGRPDALVQPIPFLDPLANQLPASAQQLLQRLAFLLALGRTGVRGREHLAIAREHPGIQGVRLRLVAAGAREGAHPQRMGHLHGDAGRPEPAHQEPFIPAGGLAHRLRGPRAVHVSQQAANARVAVFEAMHGTFRNGYVQHGL